MLSGKAFDSDPVGSGSVETQQATHVDYGVTGSVQSADSEVLISLQQVLEPGENGEPANWFIHEGDGDSLPRDSDKLDEPQKKGWRT